MKFIFFDICSYLFHLFISTLSTLPCVGCSSGRPSWNPRRLSQKPYPPKEASGTRPKHSISDSPQTLTLGNTFYNATPHPTFQGSQHLNPCRWPRFRSSLLSLLSCTLHHFNLFRFNQPPATNLDFILQSLVFVVPRTLPTEIIHDLLAKT